MSDELARLIEERSIPIPECGCWIWEGTTGKGSDGRYGTIYLNGRQIGAHRASYMAFKGAIPKGNYVCHVCDVPECVNPAHLFCGTPQKNALDMKRKGRRVQSTIYGDRNGSSKLNVDAVRIIRGSQKSNRAIARDFGVAESLIRGIRKNVYWEDA